MKILLLVFVVLLIPVLFVATLFMSTFLKDYNKINHD